MKIGDQVKLVEAHDMILRLGRVGVPVRHCAEFVGKNLEVTYIDKAEEWARVRPPTYDTSFFFPTKWLEKSSSP